MRQIRRYNNRKLYDTKESRYVTLEQLAGIIKAGETIEVRDVATESDITSKTLAQIVFVTNSGQLSPRGFHDLIRRGNKAFSVERFKGGDPESQVLDRDPDRGRTFVTED